MHRYIVNQHRIVSNENNNTNHNNNYQMKIFLFVQCVKLSPMIITNLLSLNSSHPSNIRQSFQDTKEKVGIDFCRWQGKKQLLLA